MKSKAAVREECQRRKAWWPSTAFTYVMTVCGRWHPLSAGHYDVRRGIWFSWALTVAGCSYADSVRALDIREQPARRCWNVSLTSIFVRVSFCFIMKKRVRRRKLRFSELAGKRSYEKVLEISSICSFHFKKKIVKNTSISLIVDSLQICLLAGITVIHSSRRAGKATRW